MLARDKDSGLLQTFVNYGRIQFYNIGPTSKIAVLPTRSQGKVAFFIVTFANGNEP